MNESYWEFKFETEEAATTAELAIRNKVGRITTLSGKTVELVGPDNLVLEGVDIAESLGGKPGALISSLG